MRLKSFALKELNKLELIKRSVLISHIIFRSSRECLKSWEIIPLFKLFHWNLFLFSERGFAWRAWRTRWSWRTTTTSWPIGVAARLTSRRKCCAPDAPIPARRRTSGRWACCSTRCWSAVIRSTTSSTRPSSPRSRAANSPCRRVWVRAPSAWSARCCERSRPSGRTPRTCRCTRGSRSRCGCARPRPAADPRARTNSYQSYLLILKTDSPSGEESLFRARRRHSRILVLLPRRQPDRAFAPWGVS